MTVTSWGSSQQRSESQCRCELSRSSSFSEEEQLRRRAKRWIGSHEEIVPQLGGRYTPDMVPELLTTTPELPLAGTPTVVLAHGAGAGMRHPFMASVAAGLADRGLSCVRFEFAYLAERRGRPDPQTTLQRRWHEVIEALGGGANLVIGGKSLGGRIASQIADAAGVRGLACLGYPFHAPGQPATPARIAHLGALRTPTLIVQGTRDPFGTPDEVATYSLSPQIRVLWLEDGDHSLAPRKRSGFTTDGHLATALDAIVELVRRVS